MMPIFIVAIWIIVVVSIIKSAKQAESAGNSGAAGNSSTVSGGISRIQKYDMCINRDRYSSIEKVAHEVGVGREQVIADLKNAIASGRYRNIRIDEVNGIIHYSNSVSHTHAYEHKVEPIRQATVVREQREAVRASLRGEGNESGGTAQGETSSTGWEKSISDTLNDRLAEYRVENIKQKRKKQAEVVRNAGRNGDNGYIPQNDEQAVKCGYCGANNILPRYRNKVYTCYFCREEL